MDAKSKANFINSVENNEAVMTDVNPAIPTAPAFASVEDSVQVQEVSANKYSEIVDPFALGLPEWDVVPPQIMVRRH